MLQRSCEWLRLPLAALGVVLFFVGERYFASESFHWWLSGGGLGIFFLSLASTFSLWRNAAQRQFPGEALGWRLALAWQFLVFLGLAAFLGYQKLLGLKAEPDTFSGKALLVLWLLALTFGFAMSIGVEWALRQSGRGLRTEGIRIKRAAHSSLMVGMLFAILICINYVAASRDVSRDLSYMKTASPSDSTIKMVSTLSDPVEVALFYPPRNEVLASLKEYFLKAAGKESKLIVKEYDVEMNPTAAEKFRASKNGQVILQKGETVERLDTGLTLSSARRTLKNLDNEFQKVFLSLTAAKKVAYFTRGHGELSWTASSDAPLRGLKSVETFLRSQNYNLRFFGMGEGSTKEVPVDASVIVIAGPTQNFLEEEVTAIKNYVEKGGALFVLLDIEAPGENLSGLVNRKFEEDPLIKMLAEVGIRYQPVPLANDANYVSATRSEVDKWFLYSNSFTSHESIVTLARNEERAAVLTFRSGYFSTTPDLGQWQSFETVRSLPDTFADLNRNFIFDQNKETRSAYVLGVAAQMKAATEPDKKDQKRGKIVAFSDATVISDALSRNVANLVFFAEGLRWLTGDTQMSGTVVSEEDVKIRHTRKEDLAWFWGTTALVPGLVLAAGFVATRRSSGRRRREQ